MTRSTVLGIPSPWSGDEHDPIPWTYWLWFRAYVAARRIRHRFGVHDWTRYWPEDGSARARCHWCGKRKSW